MNTNPQTYGLPTGTVLRELSSNHIAIVKLIKSRIILKDAIKIVEMVKQIRSANPSIKVSLICTSNICSKSLALLEKEGVGVKLEQ